MEMTRIEAGPDRIARSTSRARRTFSALCAGALLAVFTGTVDLDLARGLHDNRAAAIDLFGSKDDEAAEPTPEAFWSEGSGSHRMTPSGVPDGFADLAERVSPAIVNIQTRRVRSEGPRGQFPDLFEHPFLGERGRSPQRRESLGSGFVISRDGYIVTNNHVIEGADSIGVAFKDGTELEATVIGRDPKTDIALIQVTADKELPHLPLGDSDSVRPGEWVLAIGNPFGLEHTVTAGIVSAKHRNIDQGEYDDFIQTDAAINPGNSGGPLINLAGEAIGINTAIDLRANTIGFTVPINMAKLILPQLRARGYATRGWLGVVIQGISPDLAEEFELESERGALVSKVLPDGPADAADVARGDVIVAFDSEPVEEWRDLPRLVAMTPIDKTVEVDVIRKGKRKTLSVKVGEKEPDVPREERHDAPEAPSELGLRLQDITPELARQLGVEDETGVVITSVEPGSPADEAGLRRRDVILEVDREAVGDSGEIRKRLRDADESVLMLIRRGEATLFVPVKRAG
jgi:serine protease Do